MKEDYGTVTAPDGEFKIIDYIQTETKEGRQWTLSLLEDGTVAFYLESIHEKTGEKVIQTMRLTKKTIAMLQLCLVQADRQFKLEMENTAKELLKDSNNTMNIKMPNKD